MDTLKNEGYIRVIANNEQFVPYCVINLEKKQGNSLRGTDNKKTLDFIFSCFVFYSITDFLQGKIIVQNAGILFTFFSKNIA